MEQKEEQMVIALGSEIGLPFQVWHDEKQQWFKSESNEPIRDRDKPRPTYRTVLVNAPKGGCRSGAAPHSARISRRADALEYPRSLPHGGKFVTMEREHSYGGHVRQPDGSIHFDWFPVIYELVQERPCTISILAGYKGKYLRFRVRGQVRPTTEAEQDAIQWRLILRQPSAPPMLRTGSTSVANGPVPNRSSNIRELAMRMTFPVFFFS